MIEGAVYRYDQRGQRHFLTSPATKQALAVLNAAIARGEREEREAAKARQADGSLNVQERMLCAIFGEIK